MIQLLILKTTDYYIHTSLKINITRKSFINFQNLSHTKARQFSSMKLNNKRELRNTMVSLPTSYRNVPRRSMIKAVISKITQATTPIHPNCGANLVKRGLAFEGGHMKVNKQPTYIDPDGHFGVWVRFCQDSSCLHYNCAKNGQAPCHKDNLPTTVEGFATLTTKPPQYIPPSNKTELDPAMNAMGQQKSQHVVTEPQVIPSNEMRVQPNTQVSTWLQRTDIHSKLTTVLPPDSTPLHNKMQQHDDGTQS